MTMTSSCVKRAQPRLDVVRPGEGSKRHAQLHGRRDLVDVLPTWSRRAYKTLFDEIVVKPERRRDLHTWSGLDAGFGVVLLQRLDAEAFGADRRDGTDGGGRAGEGGDGRHALQHRDTADGAVVEKGFATERCIDDELNAFVEQLVADVRAPLVDLED